MLIEPIPKAFDILRLSLPSVIFTGHGEQLGLDSILFKFAHDALGLPNGHQHIRVAMDEQGRASPLFTCVIGETSLSNRLTSA